MDLGLKDKVAVVTGGARDVGREIALLLGAEGATVAVNYRGSENDAQSVVSEIKAAGGQAKAYQSDVTKFDSVRTMTEAVVKDFGGIDILVNNAGFVSPKLFLETAPDEWRKQIDIGLYGVMNCAYAMAPIMIGRGGGRIISLAGDSARVGEARLAVTAASRGGAISFTKSLAKELGPKNITANMVALGMIETSHSDPEWLDKYRDRIVKNYPLRRMGFPNDVAPAVVFLASDEARWITGQVLSVNGGFAMVG